MKSQYKNFGQKNYYYSCVDNCTHLVITKWPDIEGLEISMVNSATIDNKQTGLFGRLRRAWHALIGKPIYHAEVILPTEIIKKLVHDLYVLTMEDEETPMPLL